MERLNRENVYLKQQLADLSLCPSDMECKNLPFPCIKCNFNYSCIYGKEMQVTCNSNVACNVSHSLSGFIRQLQRKLFRFLQGIREFQRPMICRYCWQTEPWEQHCMLKDSCNSAKQYYMWVIRISLPHKANSKLFFCFFFLLCRSNCSVQSDLLCLGNRTFQKQLKCNWTHGYKWTTALFISITLGGFGADR